MKKFSTWAALILSVCLFVLSCGKDDGPDTPKTGDAPTITSFTPPSGPVGTEVTINGTNFDDTPANNTVKFGDVTASVSSATTTKLMVEVPTGATSSKITVTVGGETVTSSATFTVAEAPTSIALNEDALTLYPYPAYTAMLEVTTDIGENTVAWSSSDETVATVDADGLVTPLKIGETTITANVGGTTATCTVSVVDGPVTKLELDKEGLELFTGDTGELSIFALEADVEETSAPVWSSDNTDVATVDQEGKVTAVGTGTATITVTLDNASTTAMVNVLPTATTYVAGRDNNQPVLWINGEKTVLSEESGRAVSVYVDGDDVYVAGQLNQHPALWKNGEVTLLAENSQYLENLASSVVVENGDVYVVGHEYRDPSMVPLLWVNGVEQELPFPDGYYTGYAFSVEVHNGDIYVAGASQDNQGFKATLWKNGEPTLLDALYSKHFAYSVFVDENSDVYVAGDVTADGFPNVWVNGVPKFVGTFSFPGRALSIYVSNGNEYIAGVDDDKPALWINNEVQYLFDDDGRAEEVLVHNNKVYVAGYVEDSGYQATLWIDGEPMELPSEASSYAYSIFVK